MGKLEDKIIEKFNDYYGKNNSTGFYKYVSTNEQNAIKSFFRQELLSYRREIEKINIEEITKNIYEATRLEAKWSERSIVPEKWESREEAFKNQMIDLIEKYLSLKRLPTPKEAHNSWVKSYLKMGWRYGKKRSVALKTHPDLISYDKLPKDEKDKDAIFLAFVELVRLLKV